MNATFILDVSNITFLCKAEWYSNHFMFLNFKKEWLQDCFTETKILILKSPSHNNVASGHDAPKSYFSLNIQSWWLLMYQFSPLHIFLTCCKKKSWRNSLLSKYAPRACIENYDLFWYHNFSRHIPIQFWLSISYSLTEAKKLFMQCSFGA